MLLSELFEALHIEADAKDIADAVFTNPALLTVEPYGDEWRMYSHCSFTTQETLTITMTDGTVYSIGVTDPVSNDMNSTVAVVTLNGSSSNTQTIRPDEEYTVHLEFREVPGSVQFPTTSNELVYQIPAAFAPHGDLTNVPILLTYTEDNVTHTLDGCYYSVSGGQLTIHLTDVAQQKLATSGDGVFKIDIKGMFPNPPSTINWGGGHEWTINFDNTNSLTTYKTGTYDSATNKVKYTITVNSTGTNTGVTVHDQITGTALTLNHDVVVKDGNGVPLASQPSVTYNDGQKTFDLTLPDMNHKDRYIIEYTANVNWDYITGNGTAEQTGNSVKVKDNPPVTTNLENNISYNPLGKTVGEAVTDSTDENIKYIPWTVKVNEAFLRSMAGTHFTDHIIAPPT